VREVRPRSRPDTVPALPPVTLTQRGRGAAVLLDIAEYERLIERVEVLEDIATAEAQIAAGEGIEHEEAKQQIMSRGG
jgi:antitoxin YefM